MRNVVTGAAGSRALDSDLSKSARARRAGLTTVSCAALSLWLLGHGAASAQAAGATQAAADAGAIVVTARHRTEDVQKVPVAVSVIGAAQLDKTNTTNIQQLQQLVPSVQFTFFNARNANINIRGLGNNVGLANDGLEPGVGFYVDQVYYDRPATATFDLIDIAQIEILRGPQGTLFGKDTTAGAISLTTQSPTFKPEASAELTGGDYGYFQAKASVSGPILDDTLAGRLSVASTTREGLLTNVYYGNRVNAYRDLTLRGQLLYRPTNDIKVRLIVDYGKQDTNCCDEVLSGIVTPPNGKNFTAYSEAFGYTPVVNPFDRLADSNSPIYAKQETGGASVEADWSLPKFTLTSITAWRFWNWWPANDSDYTPISVLTKAQNGDYQNQLSQELRIASAGENRIDYVGGLYFFREQIDAVGAQVYGNASTYFLLSPALPAAVSNGYALNYRASYDTTSLAAFGQATWHVTSKLNLIGGLRYTDDHKVGAFNQIASGGAPLPATLAAIRAKLGTSDSFAVVSNKGAVSGQVGASYQVTDDVLTYLNYARGNKSGGLNMTQLPPGASPVIAPETIDSVEFGAKTRLLDRRLTLNADLFWEDDHQYQANVYDPSLLKLYLANVPEVRSQGVEVDLQAHPSDDLSLYASGVYDDAIYAKYPTAPCGLENITLPFCNLSGAALAGTPTWVLSAGGEFSHPTNFGARQVEAYVGVDYSYRSSVYSAATDSIYSLLPQLSLVNARVGVRSIETRWDAYFWAKNVFNDKYYTFVSPGVGNTGALDAQLGDPRTYGVTLRVHY